MKAKGKTPLQIRNTLQQFRKRRAKPVDAPHITNIRKALKGATYRRGRKETRGRPNALTSENVKTMLAKRGQLVRKAKGEEEVTYEKIKRKARVKVSDATISRAFKKRGCVCPLSLSRQGRVGGAGRT